MKSLFYYASFLFLIFSCESDSIIPIEDEEKSFLRKSKKVDSPPSQSGFIVTRGEGYNFNTALFIVDYEKELTVVIGLYAQMGCDPTNTTFPFQLIPFQSVNIPNNEQTRTKIQWKGDIHFEILKGTIDPFNENICTLLEDQPAYASGEAFAIINDNDQTSFEREDSKNRNTFSVNAKGTLYDHDGESVDFKLNLNGSWDGNDIETWKENVKLKLD
ncbi:hypothetical protein [Chondrinema litorale]|uniref:hypothetical protein n=1 Tax=Chondrinema litorale TaxID=2994555 RepID=UPI0025432A6C|nr:hypothetical protein [Chondrinema litorale]UZR96263.1 hypothetical protein OQ292_21595 [Chondrinema litorale]